MKRQTKVLRRAFAEAIQPPDRSPPWKWAEENIRVDPTSPFQGYWRSEVSPWVKEVMEVFADNNVEVVTVICSAQSAKTQTMICLLAWALAQEPAPTFWVTSTGDEANFFMKTRLAPTISDCQPLRVKLSGGQSAINKNEVNFAGASLIVSGSSSPSRLQSKPVRWLFLDEVRNYPEGALEMVQKRTRSYWNSRTCIVSTPDTQNDAMHRAYLTGDQRVWHYECGSCGDFVPLSWGEMKWSPDLKDERGVYDFDALAPTIRLVCPSCQNEVRDDPRVRQRLASKGKFISLNPQAPKSRVSFHWNALLPPWVKWRDLVEEFLIATSAIKNGDPTPLKDFINESVGEPWEERLLSVDDDTIDHRRGDYVLEEDWDDEFTRFMAVDVQGGGGIHYWYVIRAFAERGAKSRLISYGKLFGENDLLEVAERFKVGSARCLIDAGWNTASVLRFCQRHSWKPFRGDGAKDYSVRDKRTKRMVKQIWTENWADAGMGTRLAGLQKKIKRYVWSNPSTKNLLAELMAGQLGEWSIAKNTGQEYIQQMMSEIREEKAGARGEVRHEWRQIRRDNHLRDCELMILVASVATRKLGYDTEPIDFSKESDIAS